MNKYMLILHNRHKEIVEIPFVMDFNAPYVMCFENKKYAEQTRELLNDLINDGCEEIMAWELIEDMIGLGMAISKGFK